MMDTLAIGKICFFDRIFKVCGIDVKSVNQLNEIVSSKAIIELTVDRSKAMLWNMQDFVSKGTSTCIKAPCHYYLMS